MKTRVLLMVLVLVLVSISGIIYAQDKPLVERQLRFENISWELIAWQTNEKGRMSRLPVNYGNNVLKKNSIELPAGAGVIGPTHAAVIMIKNDRNNSFRDLDDVFQKKAKAIMSADQNTFISQNASRYLDGKSSDIYLKYTLYAVSEEDARKMAEVMVEWMDERAEQSRQGLADELIENRAIYEEARAKISEVEKKYEAAQQRWDDIARQFHEKAEIAEEKSVEFGRMLSLVKIDIAGYQAKAEIIRKLMEDIPKSQGRPPGEMTPLYATTRQLLIEQETELAGALARKRVIENELDHANSFFLFGNESSRLGNELALLKQKLRLETEIQQAEEKLADLPAEYRPATVFEDKVVIHPVGK